MDTLIWYCRALMVSMTEEEAAKWMQAKGISPEKAFLACKAVSILNKPHKA